MTTLKPFSTISFNTENFLLCKLNDLVEKRVIDFFVFIKHLPEEDEAKEHFHVYIVPNGRQDTNSIMDNFEELEIDKDGKVLNPKPLKCLPCTSSKIDDWLPYVLHDRKYLASKGQKRKYSYRYDEFQTSSKEYLNELYHKINWNKFKAVEMIEEAVANGMDFGDMLIQGMINPNMVVQYQRIFEAIQDHTRQCIRSGKIGYKKVANGKDSTTSHS